MRRIVIGRRLLNNTTFVTSKFLSLIGNCICCRHKEVKQTHFFSKIEKYIKSEVGLKTCCVWHYSKGEVIVGVVMSGRTITSKDLNSILVLERTRIMNLEHLRTSKLASLVLILT